MTSEAQRLGEAWRSGPPTPDLSAYLTDVAHADSDALLSLIQLDALERRRVRGLPQWADEDLTVSIQHYENTLGRTIDPGTKLARLLVRLELECAAGDGVRSLAETVNRLRDPYGDDIALALDEIEDAQTKQVVTSTVMDLFGEATSHAADATGRQPSSIGPYRVLSTLGEGGFGVVYLAEQTEPVRRKLAVKVIKPGMDSKAVIARFEQERQALAVMDHPNVARVIDAGTTDRGLPYFAMEYVHGKTITAYCDQRNLTIRQRLELFITVCEAVQHAHMKGIIHRDLKPSNVLVAQSDRGPIVKVIDFGVAKAISQELTQATIYTEHGQLIGTPEYMSPEQADLGSTDIDTRTDVYSLGVLLYELLIGAPPFDSSSLRAAGYAEIRRIICEVDPPKPSTRFSSLGEACAEIAKHRQSKHDELARELSRELDWIPLKAMRKDREARYRTPTDMADDIRNYLAGRPLEAGPESAAYRLRKFVTRNRGPVAAVSSVVVILIAGIIATTVALNVARTARAEEAEQRRVAEERAEVLERIARFQEGQLGGIDASIMGARLRQSILDHVRATLESEHDDERAVAEAIDTWYALHLSVNFTDVALKSLDENIFARSIAAIEEEFTDDPLHRARLLQAVASALREVGLHESALAAQSNALEIRREVLDPDDPDLLTSHHMMGLLLHELGRLPEAEEFLHIALDGRRRVLGDEHNDTIATISNLGLLMQDLGRIDEAESYFIEADKLSQLVLREDSLDRAYSLTNLGLFRVGQGRLDEAEPLFQKALRIRQSKLGEDNPLTLGSFNNLGYLRQTQGRTAEAEPHFASALAGYRAAFGSEHPDTLVVTLNYCVVLRELGRLDDAKRHGAELIEAASRSLPPGHLHHAVFASQHALTLIALQQYQQAEPRLMAAYEIFQQQLGMDHPRTIGVINALAMLYEAWHDHDSESGYALKAAEWRDRLEAITGQPAE
jgi:eukaryotic-like serine/threonine-protein kinase